MTRMIRFAFATLLSLTLAACGDNEAPPTAPDAGSDATPRCIDLGCEAALCNRAGVCTCTPPGEDPITCIGGGAAALATCPDAGCPGSTTARRLSPVCTAGGCVCGADPAAPVSCAPTCTQLGCAPGTTGTCDAPGFPLACN